MHLDLTLSIGNIAVLIAISGVIWRVGRLSYRVERLFNLYGIEHEMLMVDYCARLGIALHDLPTRSKGLSKA